MAFAIPACLSLFVIKFANCPDLSLLTPKWPFACHEEMWMVISGYLVPAGIHEQTAEIAGGGWESMKRNASKLIPVIILTDFYCFWKLGDASDWRRW